MVTPYFMVTPYWDSLGSHYPMWLQLPLSLMTQLTRCWLYPLTLTLKMTTAQVVEMSVTVNNNSAIQDYVHPDNHTQPTYEITPGFKPLTNCPLLFTLCLELPFTLSCIATPSFLIITLFSVSSFFRCSQLITNIYVP